MTKITDHKGSALATLCLQLRRGGRVRRWHTEPGMRPETVGEHTFGAALMLALIAPEASVSCYQAVLLHDLTEQAIGDIPAPARWASAALRSACSDLEAGYLASLGIHDPFPLLTEQERVLVQAADVLASCYTTLEAMADGVTDAFTIAERLRNESEVERICQATPASRSLYSWWRQVTAEDLPPRICQDLQRRLMVVEPFDYFTEQG